MHRTILILAGLGLAQAALAEPRDYAFDMAHSRIFFDVDHRGYSVMQGRFAEFGGTFRYDAENPANSSLDITINPASVDMFHEGLNNHLKTADFFNVEQYPEMRFVSERVEVVGDGQFKVHGQFTMIGQTQPLAFDVKLNQTGTARGGGAMAGFTATGTLDRAAYGMRYGVPAVGQNVSFRIEIEASEAPTS